MSLLTVERNTPSPYESLDNDDVQSSSSYEGFVAKEHLAVSLTPRTRTSLSRNGVSFPIHAHLKRIIKLMRPCDSLKMAVELEKNCTRDVRKYLIVIMYMDQEDSEETLILGTEHEDTVVKLCLVLPVWGDTQIKLDGDGGFIVHTGDQHRIFKPMSVQSMWTTLQTLYKSTEVARACNHYVGGLSHSWLSYYKALMTDDWNILNEWNIMEDVVSMRSGSPQFAGGNSDEKQTFEDQLVNRLREVMMGVDLEEVSSKQLRLKLEEEMKMDLKEYREFLDQHMLRILGQMEKPSKICDYLYLGSEWNAANLEELKRLGVGYILNVTREIDNFFPEMFTYFNVRLYDLPDSELIKHWDKTYQFIKTAKEKGSKVLVHCKMGISRSAATVVAYKMKEYELALDDALAYVKSRRSCINPNDGFIQQLRAYEGILSARHNELWGKHAPNRLLPHQRTMSEPNIRSMSPNTMEADYPLSPHNEEQPFTHQFMSTNDLQQDENSHSNRSPTRSNLRYTCPVDKTEGVIQFLNSLPPLSDNDEVYRDHCECTNKPRPPFPFLTPPESRRSDRRKESPLHSSTAGLYCPNVVTVLPKQEGPAVAEVKAAGEEGGLGGMATNNGCPTAGEEYVAAPGSAPIVTAPSTCNPILDVDVAKCPDGEEGEGTLVQTKQISSVPERVKEIEEKARGLLVLPLVDKVIQRPNFGSTNSLDEGSRPASPHPVDEAPIATVSAGGSKHASVSPRLSSSSTGPLSPLQGNGGSTFPCSSSVGGEPSENKEKVGDELVNCAQGGGVKAKIMQMEELTKDVAPVTVRRKDSLASADKTVMAALEKKAGVETEAKRPLSGGEERKKEEKKEDQIVREDEKKKVKEIAKEEEKKKEKETLMEEEKKKVKDIVKEEEKKKVKEIVKEEEKKKEKETLIEEEKKKVKDIVKEEEKKKEKEIVVEEEKKKVKEIMKEEEKKKVKETVKEEEKKKEKETMKEDEKKKEKEVREDEKSGKESGKDEPKKDDRMSVEEDKKEKLIEKKGEDQKDKDSDSEVSSVLTLRRLFGDPEPKKPETQQWQQLQLFAKTSPKPQETPRSASPSFSTPATPSVKKELQPPNASAH